MSTENVVYVRRVGDRMEVCSTEPPAELFAAGPIVGIDCVYQAEEWIRKRTRVFWLDVILGATVAGIAFYIITVLALSI